MVKTYSENGFNLQADFVSQRVHNLFYYGHSEGGQPIFFYEFEGQFKFQGGQPVSVHKFSYFSVHKFSYFSVHKFSYFSVHKFSYFSVHKFSYFSSLVLRVKRLIPQRKLSAAFG